MGENSAAIVKELDHATGRWSADKIVGVSPFVDKHNYPGMLRGPDGRIYVFYGCHNSTLRLAVSPKPLSIDGTWEDRFIDEAERASYPAPVVTADGHFYVFYRDTRKTSGHADDRPYQVVKSTDGGKTWKRQMIADPYPRTTDSMCEVYNGKVTYQPPGSTGSGRCSLIILRTVRRRAAAGAQSAGREAFAGQTARCFSMRPGTTAARHARTPARRCCVSGVSAMSPGGSTLSIAISTVSIGSINVEAPRVGVEVRVCQRRGSECQR